jgi:hypothetical protein
MYSNSLVRIFSGACSTRDYPSSRRTPVLSGLDSDVSSVQYVYLPLTCHSVGTRIYINAITYRIQLWQMQTV